MDAVKVWRVLLWIDVLLVFARAAVFMWLII